MVEYRSLSRIFWSSRPSPSRSLFGENVSGAENACRAALRRLSHYRIKRRFRSLKAVSVVFAVMSCVRSMRSKSKCRCWQDLYSAKQTGKIKRRKNNRREVKKAFGGFSSLEKPFMTKEVLTNVCLTTTNMVVLHSITI